VRWQRAGEAGVRQRARQGSGVVRQPSQDRRAKCSSGRGKAAVRQKQRRVVDTRTPQAAAVAVVVCGMLVAGAMGCAQAGGVVRVCGDRRPPVTAVGVRRVCACGGVCGGCV